MHTVPGIHVATGHFHRERPADRRRVGADRRATGLRLGEWLSAGVDSRHAPARTQAAHPTGVAVLFEGYLSAIEGRADPSAPAAAVLALYLESGLDCLPRLRGSYTGLILDPRANVAHLFNDRRASRPLFCRESADGALLIGPEVLELAAAAPAIEEIDPVAVCEFVTFASYYGDRTLFPAIRKLPPGAVMSIRPGALALRRYWTIRIDPDKPPRSEAACVDEALALFEQSLHRLATAGTRPFLFLSGGIDSRVILGGLRSAGQRLPAVTYGTDAGDDAPIARRLAEHCGLPFTHYPIPAAAPEHLFVDAALRSDCRAETVDTPTHGELVDELAASFDLFQHGDKSFYGKHAACPAQALAATGLFSLAEAPRFADMLDPAIRRDAYGEIDATLRTFLAAGADIDPGDLKDKLYYEQRLANRQNAFTAGNLRRLEQGRPWLDEDLVDFLFALPASVRRDKYLNRSMVERAAPDLAALPYASRDSIPHARAYRDNIPAQPALAEFVRAQFSDALDPRLGALFRRGSLAALADSVARGTPLPPPDTRWWHGLPGAWRISTRRYRRDRIHPASVMLRLMQINLYLQALNRRAHAQPTET